MRINRLIFRVHAVQRMYQRRVSEADVRHILETGEIIESYPDRSPYPSTLVLGWKGSRPLHIVVAENTAGQETIVITVYEPTEREWSGDFKRRTRP